MSDTQRLGVYMHSHTFDLARSAYLADLDTLPDRPDSFGAWIDAAIAQHADLTPTVRATLERGLYREMALPILCRPSRHRDENDSGCDP